MNYHNFAQKTNWTGGSEAFGDLPFYLTSVNIPGINLTNPEIGGRNSTQINVSGDTLKYNSLSFEMLIDEDFKIYKDFYDFIKKGIDIENGTFDISEFDFWIELANSKGTNILKIEFYNCKIESIGDIVLDTTDESTEHNMSVEIVFDFFEIV